MVPGAPEPGRLRRAVAGDGGAAAERVRRAVGGLLGARIRAWRCTVKATKAELTPMADSGLRTTTGIVQRLRVVVAHRAEEILAEVPATLRRLRTFLLVLSISVPLFLVGLVAVLWHLAH